VQYYWDSNYNHCERSLCPCHHCQLAIVEDLLQVRQIRVLESIWKYEIKLSSTINLKRWVHPRLGFIRHILGRFDLRRCREGNARNATRMGRMERLQFPRARYTRENAQVVTNLQQTCSNAVPTTCQQDVFALLVPSLLTSWHLATSLLSSTDLSQVVATTCYRSAIQQYVNKLWVTTL
jgi:hypothetical protein